MKKKYIFCIVFLFSIFLLIITYISVDYYVEHKHAIGTQIMGPRNELFNICLDLKHASSENKNLKYIKEEFKDEHFSNLDLNDKYLCFLKKQKSVTGAHYLIVIFIKKDTPDLFYSFLVNYRNIEIAYFNPEVKFFILKIFDNDFLTNKFANNQTKLIKWLFRLISNTSELRKISKEQLITERP